MALSKLSIELTNLCNLDCAYCFKDLGTVHLDPSLVEKVLKQARELGATKVTYTGGEVTLYPHLAQVLKATTEHGFRYALVTNGWHFAKLLPVLQTNRSALHHLFFSMDAADEAAHDQVRGKGSFRKIMKAVSLCRVYQLPFSFQLVVNRSNLHSMETLAILGARLGAASVKFSHMLPTSSGIDDQLSLTENEMLAAEVEARALDAILKIHVEFTASESQTAPVAPCEPLANQTVNIDCRGKLSLCCQLASYRNGNNDIDIIADLAHTDLASAYQKFLVLAAQQLARRNQALAERVPGARFPCHFCVTTLDKTPWQEKLYTLGQR